MKTTTTIVPRPLPSCITSAITSIRWPLDNENHPPLHLKPLNDMKTIRTTTNKSRLDLTHPLSTINVENTLQELFTDDDDTKYTKDNIDFAIISIGLILIGHGCIDEAHSLITPYSWPDEIHFNHGPVRYHTVSEPVKTYATYTHSLIHRYEAYNIGEFGMLGWDNANYWSGSTQRTKALNELPHYDWFIHISKVDEEYPIILKSWMNEHNIYPDSNYYFDNRSVHELCQLVMMKKNENNNKELLQMAVELISEIELRVVLAHTLIRSGFDCTVEGIISNR